MTPWGAIIQAAFGFLKPLFAPFAAYLKGRSDAKRNERLKADEQFIDRVAASKRAADDANRVPIDIDPNNRDRKS
jgi:hypothetical protein